MLPFKAILAGRTATTANTLRYALTMVNPNSPSHLQPPDSLSLREHEIEIRVRYQETDAQGRVHHATYINYFEIGRVEFLRAAGYSYRQLEEDGIQLVVTEVGCQYFQGAMYDDLLTLKTKVIRSKGVRIRHDYELRLGDELVVTGHTIVASVGKDGKVKRLPKWLTMDPSTPDSSTPDSSTPAS